MHARGEIARRLIENDEIDIGDERECDRARVRVVTRQRVEHARGTFACEVARDAPALRVEGDFAGEGVRVAVEARDIDEADAPFGLWRLESRFIITDVDRTASRSHDRAAHARGERCRESGRLRKVACVAGIDRERERRDEVGSVANEAYVARAQSGRACEDASGRA